MAGARECDESVLAPGLRRGPGAPARVGRAALQGRTVSPRPKAKDSFCIATLEALREGDSVIVHTSNERLLRLELAEAGATPEEIARIKFEGPGAAS